MSRFAFILLFALSSAPVLAGANLNVAIVSDYLLNGVSQTDGAPAAQVAFEYVPPKSDLYFGAWLSNVNFEESELYTQDKTNLEGDAYLGLYFEGEDSDFDIGLTHYSYHGDKKSSDRNYSEAYAKLGIETGSSRFDFRYWYSWDFQGTKTSHYVGEIGYSLIIHPGHTLGVFVNKSESNDTRQFSWEGDSSYTSYRLVYRTYYRNIDFEVAASEADLDADEAGSRVSAGVAITF